MEYRSYDGPKDKFVKELMKSYKTFLKLVKNEVDDAERGIYSKLVINIAHKITTRYFYGAIRC